MSVRLAASNIGWTAEQDAQVLRWMAEHGFFGLEIAPTRLFPVRPYEDLARAAACAAALRAEYGLGVCSMQSIWYGRTARIAESAESRRQLLDYTGEAIRFADALGCRNLVFGCPRNRAIRSPDEAPIVEDFLWRCAEAARPFGVVIALEPNPPLYHTNYLNTTAQALELLKRLDHPALKLNLDLGTVAENAETLDWIDEDGVWIHHVHISEPLLVPLRERPEHRELMRRLKALGYTGCVSVEMKAQADPSALLRALEYLGRIEL